MYWTRKLKRKILQGKEDPLRKAFGEGLFVNVDPLRIRFVGFIPAERRKGRNKYVYAYLKGHSRFILPGDWDLHLTPFANEEKYRFIKELCLHKFDYTKCSRFATLMKDVREGTVSRYKNKGVVIDSEAAVHRYMQGHVNVCKSMKTHGYLPEKAKDNICVMIGRGGAIIKEMRGRHRLAIAQVLGIRSVLVQVRHVHPLWVKEQRRNAKELSVEEVIRRAINRMDILATDPSALEVPEPLVSLTS